MPSVKPNASTGNSAATSQARVVEALHASRGRPFHVDDETARLIEFGAKLWQLSEGAFDLTSGLLRRAWNFDEGPVAANTSLIPQLIGRIGWQRVTWQPPTITLPEGMEIDFGGIGKEYAVDLVADHAASVTQCPVLVNFGGDLRCTGAAPKAGAWQVGIESIESIGEAARRIELKSGALATSGDARRHIEIDGRRYGHIFDARTGWPAPDAPRSITVAAATCSQAGSYSTLAMLKGAGAEDLSQGRRACSTGACADQRGQVEGDAPLHIREGVRPLQCRARIPARACRAPKPPAPP